MKIALVVHDFDPRYGQGCYAVELARRLAPRHDVHVHANTFAAPLEPNLTFQKVHAWRRSTALRIVTFLRSAEKLLRRRHYDLIHAQGLTCWQADVITAHICNAARQQNAAGSATRSSLFAHFIRPLERRFYQQPRARHLLAVSRRVADEIKTHYGWQRDTTVIHHGIDTERFHPPTSEAERTRDRKAFHLEAAGWVWLFVGEAAKGLRQVVDLLPFFPEAMLLAVTRSSFESFRQQAAALGVTERVRFHGPADDTAPLYRAADVFVYPSDYDAFGLVVAEAMASGLPVVASRHIGAAEWIEHQRNGLLADPADAAALREALAWLKADPARVCMLGMAARETARRHTWDACAEATAAVYDQVQRSRHE
jgi:UDP-glucose:(heptosyl)LPS alpha-1,3-glucosyltransferase